MPLSFVADENVEIEVVDALRALGHAVTHVSEVAPGAEDEEVLSRALREGSILVTNDKDFGKLIFRQRRGTAGVLLMRMPGLEPKQKADLVARGVGISGDKIQGSLVVVTRRRVRVRRPPL